MRDVRGSRADVMPITSGGQVGATPDACFALPAVFGAPLSERPASEPSPLPDYLTLQIDLNASGCAPLWMYPIMRHAMSHV
jgi:hypothetical protein